MSNLEFGGSRVSDIFHVGQSRDEGITEKTEKWWDQYEEKERWEVVNKKCLTIKKKGGWKSHIGIGVRKNGSSFKAIRGEVNAERKWQATSINLVPKGSLEK